MSLTVLVLILLVRWYGRLPILFWLEYIEGIAYCMQIDYQHMEKPLNFAPFGHAELSLLAKI